MIPRPASIIERLEMISPTAACTQELGRRLGMRLGSGAVVALIGPLGSGKTCLAQGLARGLGVPAAQEVTSPSYTLINQYDGRVPLIHVDLYRLSGEADAEAIGLFELLESAAVTVIEWAERLDAQALGGHLRIELDVAGAVRHVSLTDCGLGVRDLLRELAAWHRGAGNGSGACRDDQPAGEDVKERAWD